MSKKYKELAFVHSKELKIPNEIWERFQDLSKPHITFQDTLDSALCVSAKLRNEENFNYIQSLIDAEKSLKDNETFKSLAKISENIKKSFEPPQSVKDYLKNQQEASKKLYEMHKPMIDAMNEVRNKKLKSLPNPTSIVPTLEKVRHILDTGIDESVKRSKFHEEKAQELEIAIKEIDDQVEVEKYKAEYKMHTEEAIKYMELVQPYEPMTVSKYGKQLEKDLQPLIIRDRTKDSADGGITYKQKQKLIRVRNKYDRLILNMSRTRAKNILMKDEGWTPGTLNKNLTKAKKLLQK